MKKLLRVSVGVLLCMMLLSVTLVPVSADGKARMPDTAKDPDNFLHMVWGEKVLYEKEDGVVVEARNVAYTNNWDEKSGKNMGLGNDYNENGFIISRARDAMDYDIEVFDGLYDTEGNLLSPDVYFIIGWTEMFEDGTIHLFLCWSKNYWQDKHVGEVTEDAISLMIGKQVCLSDIIPELGLGIECLPLPPDWRGGAMFLKGPLPGEPVLPYPGNGFPSTIDPKIRMFSLDLTDCQRELYFP